MRVFSLICLFIFAVLCVGLPTPPAAAQQEPQYEIRCINGRCYKVLVQQPAKVVAPNAETRRVVPPEVIPQGGYPTGVVSDKISIAPKYQIGERVVDQTGVYQAIGDGLVDDTKKPFVAIIDNDVARRASVVAALKTSLGDKVKLWDGPPDDWSFQTGFKTDGHPTIYAQLPTGDVKHRQDDVADGLDVAIGAVRKAFPDYDPTKDPDLRKPPKTPLGGGFFNFDLGSGENQIALGMAAIALVGVGFLALKKQPAAAH